MSSNPFSRGARHQTADAESILRARLDAGTIDQADFHRRLAVLRLRPTPRRKAGVVVMLAVGGVALAAAAAGLAYAAQNSSEQPLTGARTTSCSFPPLSGQVVHVTLSDMNMMQTGMMAGYGTGSITISTSTVHAGVVSLRVANMGTVVHELVVLPLPSGSIGERSVGANRRVSESGSLGEASATCAAGAGDGIASHAESWVTLTLPAGRYELICNIPGHYAAGMRTELDVTA